LASTDRGVAAALFHIYTNADSVMPTIGASGAIAAVMGAYFPALSTRAHRDARATRFFRTILCRARGVVSGWWFIMQFFSGTLSLVADPSQAGGIAWWAHIGGFIFGALLCSVIKVQHFYRRNHEEEFDWLTPDRQHYEPKV